MKLEKFAIILAAIVTTFIVASLNTLAVEGNKNTDITGRKFELLQQQITELGSKIEADELDDEEMFLILQQQIDTLKNDMLALQAKVSAVQQEIQVLQQDAQANKLKIEGLQTQLTALQSQLSTTQSQLTTKLTELQGQITLLQQSISDAISQSNTTIADLQARIALLERKTLTHPSLAALVAGAYCQARNADNYLIYAVSREWSTDGSCESACRNFRNDGLGHWTGHGIGDLGCDFRFDAEGRLISVGGRPDSRYVQADNPYCDWCCCIAN